MRPFRFLPLLTLFFVSCIGDTNGPGLPVDGGGYPAAIGTRWTYAYRSTPYDFVPLLPGAVYAMDTMTATTQATVLGKIALPRTPGVSGDSITTLEIEQVETMPGPGAGAIVSYGYYTIDSAAMLMHGYRGGGTLSLPRISPGGTTLAFHGLRASTVAGLRRLLAIDAPASALDAPMREIPPLTVVRFPFKQGERWTYRGNQSYFHIEKKVGGDTTITAGGVQYGCTRVHWLYDFNFDGITDDQTSIVDYYAEEGLVRREIHLKDVLISDATSPDGIGRVNILQVYQLTSFTRGQLPA